jgi:hypothetical protein
MTNQHPITPPPELVQAWFDEAVTASKMFEVKMKFATFAARWGADQELEACCEWLDKSTVGMAELLYTARRPKPPTLNSIALQMLSTIEQSEHFIPEITDTIRKALEALPND